MSDRDRNDALRALKLLDLTDLSDDCAPRVIDALCRRALTPHGAVAAVCIWPRFVARAKGQLEGSTVRIATVVNFPGGDAPFASVLGQVRTALDEGADEIDMVIDYRAFAAGARAAVGGQIADLRKAMGRRARLKVILETGVLGDAALIKQAAHLAIASGAQFIKTSTGKVGVNATPQAARIMLRAIQASGKPVGFKPAGGIRTLADTRAYLALADEIMGPRWAKPATFRFGASGVLDALLATLDGKAAPGAAATY